MRARIECHRVTLTARRLVNAGTIGPTATHAETHWLEGEQITDRGGRTAIHGPQLRLVLNTVNINRWTEAARRHEACGVIRRLSLDCGERREAELRQPQWCLDLLTESVDDPASLNLWEAQGDAVRVEGSEVECRHTRWPHMEQTTTCRTRNENLFGRRSK